MNVEVKETSAVERALEVSIPQEDLRAPFEKKLNRYRKEIQIKGFRQGSVPKNIIISRFGESIRHEVIDETVNELLTNEMKKAGIVPVGRAKVENFKDDQENPITFTAIVQVDPEIDIKGYKDLGITVPDTLVLEEEAEGEYNRLMQMWSRDAHVDRPAEKGDVVIGDYLEVIIEGETQELPEQREFRSLIGESASPGFDEGLLGVSAGETKEISFKYPDDHKDEKYRGKSATFKVEIKDIHEVLPPTKDEEFFKQIGVKDDEELKQTIRENLATNKRNAAKTKALNEAIDKLIEMNPFEVPSARVEDLIRYTLSKHSGNQAEEIQPTEEEMNALSPEAIREIKKHRILDFIANAEKLKATPELVDARVQQMANAYNIDAETLKTHLRKSGRLIQIREELRIEQAADFIVGIRTEETKEEEAK